MIGQSLVSNAIKKQLNPEKNLHIWPTDDYWIWKGRLSENLISGPNGV